MPLEGLRRIPPANLAATQTQVGLEAGCTFTLAELQAAFIRLHHALKHMSASMRPTTSPDR